MTKSEARIWVYELMVRTLRNRAEQLSPHWITSVTPKKHQPEKALTPKQVDKCRQAMVELADKLDEKLTRMKGISHGQAPGGAQEGSEPDAASSTEAASGLPE